MHAVLLLIAMAGGSGLPPGAVEPPVAALRLPAGTRVNFMASDDQPMHRIPARLLSSDADSVTFDTAKGPRRIERERLYHVEYMTRSRDRGKGAKIGAAITGVAGLIAGGVLVARESDGGSCGQCGIAVVFVGAVAALPGAGIGYAIGASSTDWRVASPRGVTVVGGRQRPRIAVAVRIGP